MMLVACGGDNGDDDKDNPESASATPQPPTPTPFVIDEDINDGTSQPTFTPEAQTPITGVELLGGSPDSCVNEDTEQSTILGFDAMYYQFTTANSTVVEMSTEALGVFASASGPGENKDGEEGWAFYPVAYELEDNTIITVRLTTYAGTDDTSDPISLSVLEYDCTTGETISRSYNVFDE